VGILEAESFSDSATARSMASFVGKGGGLWDRSVKESDGPSSVAARVGVKDRVWRSLSISSLECSRAEDGSISSV